MEAEKFLMFRNRLLKVFKHLGKQAKRLGVECYRIYDHDLPEFPFIIEKYGEKVHVAEYKRRHGLSDEEHDWWLSQSVKVIEEVLAVPKEDIYLKLRERKAGRQGQYQKMGEEKKEFIASENGLKFIVNLSEYLDTGLFLDHRNTRQMVKENAMGRKVLNLFCYTGSFTVYAAAGGADEIVSVDLSKTYLEWAERNLLLNGFKPSDKYKFIQADVLEYMSALPGDYFNLVVLDPPTFSNSKRMKGFLDIQRDHATLINDCLRVMKINGELYFSTNYRGFVLEKEKIKTNVIRDITKLTTPFDFGDKLKRYCYLIVNRV